MDMPCADGLLPSGRTFAPQGRFNRETLSQVYDGTPTANKREVWGWRCPGPSHPHPLLNTPALPARQYAKAGIVDRVVVRNFMCHKYLEVTLGPLVNFVVGSNGAGKSAILTALVVVFGGKTTVTARGTSLKELVKRGET